MALHAPPTADGLAPLRLRLLVLAYVAALAFGGLLMRLYSLQILRGEEMRSKGRRNFVSQIDLPHDRGALLDRQGRVLVDNRASLDLQLTPAFLGSKEQAERTLTQLAVLTGLPSEGMERAQAALAARTGVDRFRPVIVWRDLPPGAVEAVHSARSVFLLDGVDIAESRRRSFRYGSMAAHALGYVGEIDGSLLDGERQRGNPMNYQPGESIGRDGLERTLEHHLRGRNGSEKIVVDAKGRRQHHGDVDALLGERRRQEPVPGHNVYLTLDAELQRVAEASFLRHGRAGSVVAIDAHTFEVLVLASLPAYDVNVVSGTFRFDEKARLDADVLKPWLNRSVAGQYAPGSTFKVVTGLAALESDPAASREPVVCPGSYKLGAHTWRCHRDSGHGSLTLLQAMQRSCDVFFYAWGAKLGIEPMAQMARALGLGQRTGILLRGEQPGLVPDEAFHRRVDRGYVRGMAVNTSIGQGSSSVTPLQLAVAYASVAHGQRPRTPALVAKVESADWRAERLHMGDDGTVARWCTAGDAPAVLERVSEEPAQALCVAPASLQVVRDALFAVAQSRGGTAYRFRSQKVSMAGKTGTTQVVKLGKERLQRWQTEYFARDHAWFVAYAPAENPAIVVAVINEHGGHGGSAAAPVAVDVIDAWAAQYLGRSAPGQGAP